MNRHDPFVFSQTRGPWPIALSAATLLLTECDNQPFPILCLNDASSDGASVACLMPDGASGGASPGEGSAALDSQSRRPMGMRNRPATRRPLRQTGAWMRRRLSAQKRTARSTDRQSRFQRRRWASPTARRMPQPRTRPLRSRATGRPTPRTRLALSTRRTESSLRAREPTTVAAAKPTRFAPSRRASRWRNARADRASSSARAATASRFRSAAPRATSVSTAASIASKGGSGRAALCKSPPRARLAPCASTRPARPSPSRISPSPRPTPWARTARAPAFRASRRGSRTPRSRFAASRSSRARVPMAPREPMASPRPIIRWTRPRRPRASRTSTRRPRWARVA